MSFTTSEFSSEQKLWELIEPYGSMLSFQRNSMIYNPNQPAQALYFLQSGQVSLQLLSSSGRVLTLRVIDAGDIFGHSMLMGSPTYDSFAEVTRPANILVLSQNAVQQALADLPALGLMLLETVGKYRLAISRRLDEVAFKSVPARLASLLLDMAEGVSEGQPLRLPRRTHQQLAEMINAYRETVTKVINQFRAAQLLDIDRSGITLLNLSGLRELAQGQAALPGSLVAEG